MGAEEGADAVFEAEGDVMTTVMVVIVLTVIATVVIVQAFLHQPSHLVALLLNSPSNSIFQSQPSHNAIHPISSHCRVLALLAVPEAALLHFASAADLRATAVVLALVKGKKCS
ncbi:hypothetical protein niasHS_002639 [Heterodera schachtii]|uniref:Uncharacterized protein n=1 Tax=Heterodera schachtii TaxID=97005 RepID=A0ABD2K2J7_HETSC